MARIPEKILGCLWRWRGELHAFRIQGKIRSLEAWAEVINKKQLGFGPIKPLEVGYPCWVVVGPAPTSANFSQRWIVVVGTARKVPGIEKHKSNFTHGRNDNLPWDKILRAGVHPTLIFDAPKKISPGTNCSRSRRTHPVACGVLTNFCQNPYRVRDSLKGGVSIFSSSGITPPQGLSVLSFGNASFLRPGIPAGADISVTKLLETEYFYGWRCPPGGGGKCPETFGGWKTAARVSLIHASRGFIGFLP